MIGKFFKSKSSFLGDEEEVRTEEDGLGSSKTNEKVLQQIRKDFQSVQNEIKILLLGAGESGKSTIFKQMKIINIGDYNTEERMDFKEQIGYNVLSDFRVIIEGCEKLEIRLKEQKTVDTAEKILEACRNHKMIALDVLTKDFTKSLKDFWKDKDVQEAFNRKSEFHLNDSASYFFEKIEEISQKEYVPTNKDILLSRRRTTGVTETNFSDKNGNTFKMIDVGGQRSERKKWLKVFDNVTAVLFITSLSEYDQNLYEDDTKNRMQESLELFEEIVELPYFKKTAVITFFNKYDLFKEKIKKVDLGNFFKNYKDGLDEEKAKKFIQTMFLSKSKGRTLVSHFTNATDTDLIKNIFNDVKGIVLQKHLENNRLL